MITLSKGDEPADLDGVTKMGIGVSWDPSSGSDRGLLGWARKKAGMDLDLIAVLCRGNEPVRLAGLDSQDPLGNRAVWHSGDEHVGAGSGDDETVEVTFKDVPSVVTKIVFVAAAFKKNTSFSGARNISFKVYDASGGTTAQVADIWPSLLGRENANAVAKAVRQPSGSWTLEVLDVKGNIRQGDEQSLLKFAADK